MPLTRRLHSLIGLAAATALLAGCTGISGDDGSSDTAQSDSSSAQADAGVPADPSTDEAYSEFYDQDLDWQSCEGKAAYQCTTVTVPLDWAEPSGETIELAVVKAPASSGDSEGPILLNPGGPGGSGVESVEDSLEYLVTQPVTATHDVIGFDPRGVGSSTAVKCLSDEETDAYLSGTGDFAGGDPETDEGYAKSEAVAEKLADACEQNSPKGLLDHVDTVSAARDMDVIRAALGSDVLDYLGFSYGTFLGSTYAGLYPSRAGHMVLDGAMDPELDGDELTLGQAKGFEQALDDYLGYCSEHTSTCPLAGMSADDAKGKLSDFISGLEDTPLATSDPDRPLTQSLALNGLLMTFYNDEYWPLLSQSLSSAFRGDGSYLLQLADASSERGDDGTYAGNANFAISAINCVDRPTAGDKETQRADAKELEEASPTFGPYLAYGGILCSQWPAEETGTPESITADGSDTLLVIGTTKDPATPLPWAKSLHSQLSNSRLVIWEGEGHTAYGRSGGCVEDIVESYFADGTVPDEDTTMCS